MKIKIIAKLSDLKDGMAKAFENFAIRGGFKVTEKSMFRCTKLEVSKEIDEYFWKYYRDQIEEKYPNMNDEDIKREIAMLMLMNGAKRNEELDKWEVVMEDDFVDNESEE